MTPLLDYSVAIKMDLPVFEVFNKRTVFPHEHSHRSWERTGFHLRDVVTVYAVIKL